MDERTGRAFVFDQTATPSGGPVTVQPPEGWAAHDLRWLKQQMTWLPFSAPKPPAPIVVTHGSVTVLDLTRL